MTNKLKIVKPLRVEHQTTKLNHNDEILLNDTLNRLSVSLRIIDQREIANDYYMRVRQYLADFEKLWGFGNNPSKLRGKEIDSNVKKA